MERPVDWAHRVMCYIASAVDNPACAAAMTRHWSELRALVIDETGEEVFQITYCRVTLRYKEGDDFVKMFKGVFYNTRREMAMLGTAAQYYDGIHTKTEEEEEGAAQGE